MAQQPLNQLLKAKQQKEKLTVQEVAKQLGVSEQSASRALRGMITPNKSTKTKYMKFLGLSEKKFDAAAKLIKPVKASAKRGGSGLSFEEAGKVANDPLAVATHQASKHHREVIAVLLKVKG